MLIAILAKAVSHFIFTLSLPSQNPIKQNKYFVVEINGFINLL